MCICNVGLQKINVDIEYKNVKISLSVDSFATLRTVKRHLIKKEMCTCSEILESSFYFKERKLIDPQGFLEEDFGLTNESTIKVRKGFY